MSRPTTILAVVQMFLVVTGYFTLGAILKLNGYPNEEVVRWRALPVFLREHGTWLLLLPVAWVGYATITYRRDRGWVTYSSAIGIGICIAIALFVMFVYAALHTYTIPSETFIKVLKATG